MFAFHFNFQYFNILNGTLFIVKNIPIAQLIISNFKNQKTKPETRPKYQII